jgi:ATP-dependent Clp protease adaptor protein ClpS
MSMSEKPGTTVRPKTRKKSKTRLLPPYNVILLNDDFHSPEFVIEVLFNVFAYQIEKCAQLMLEAHETGRSIVWSGSKEVAELKHEQVRTFSEKRDGQDIGPLGCEIEPAP